MPRFINGWILDGQYRQLSKQTLILRRTYCERLSWWLNREGHEECGAPQIKGFLCYVTTGHTEPGGRYGIAGLTKPVRSRTVKDTHGILRSFFLWMVAEGYVDESPMASVKAPIHRADQIQPFTEDQINGLLRAAKASRHPKRDEALITFMLDTGVRASELCNLCFDDLDIVSRKAIVLGKGNKHRAIYFGRETGRLVWQYIRAQAIEGKSPLFVREKGSAFTRNGLGQLLQRLGAVARIEATRCSPHTLRHTFAEMFLRGGGSVFTLKEMLGHTDLAMTSRYVALAQADVQDQHRQFSPVERLRGRK
ncbi:MAG TPA: tyrosine-type recombinase/integrase [Fimbriimonas sp.]|nr:tyrosine-type recombinase/integrase [Fimbriimonas sp.]